MDSEIKDKSLTESFCKLIRQYSKYLRSLSQFKCHYHNILLPPGPSLSSALFISEAGTGVARAEG